ncbi:MAG: hypothetical protein QM286_05370 [Acidobacteriota bacterium]|nr:hypothetical protein [Acidobacteriota bacterium]
MSDLYKYTFAELEFLLGDRAGWPQGRQLLGLKPESAEGVRMAGAASLLVRGLAKVEGADIVVDPAVMVPALVLASGGEVFGLALSRHERLALSSLVITREPAGRILVSPDLPGIFELRPLSVDVEPLAMLTEISLGVVGEMGMLAIGHGDTVLQIQHQDGTWSWRTTEDQPMVTAPEGEIRQQIARVFGPVLEV